MAASIAFDGRRISKNSVPSFGGDSENLGGGGGGADDALAHKKKTKHVSLDTDNRFHSVFE